MTAGEPVVLDACVLIPMPLADTLLRMAEFPGLYEPQWSEEILSEVKRNLVARLGLSERQASRREMAQRSFFPNACVTGYEQHIDAMRNHPKDRHVLAAAIQCRARLLVSSNLKDFPGDLLRPLGIECVGPSEFLRRLYKSAPAAVENKLLKQAGTIGLPLEELLKRLFINAPDFVRFYCEQQHIDLT
jgi:hypothetical protein